MNDRVSISMCRIDNTQKDRARRIGQVDNMHTAVPDTTAKIAAVADNDGFEKLLVISGVIPCPESRGVRIRNIVNEDTVTVVTALDRDVAVRVNVRESYALPGAGTDLGANRINIAP